MRSTAKPKRSWPKCEAKNEGYSGDKLYDDYTAYKKIIYEANHHVYGQMSAQAIAKSQGESYDTLSSHYQLFNDFLTSATQKLQIGGYKIYTTINKPIYDSMQQYTQNYSGYEPDKWKVVQDPKTGKNKTVRDPMQVGSVLIKNDTGAIISFVGGRGFGLSQINHATQTLRQNGSTMKPLLVYAPAMELGLIQPGSIVADLPYKRVLSSGVYQPEDYSGRFHGFETARKALYQSDNVPAVSIFTRLSRATNSAPDYLKKMGFTSLVGSDGHNISAALGGITRGVTVEENTNAYATFGNGGRFVDAYLIDKITDSSGHVIYRHKTQPTRVFSPQTNYLMLDMMRDVLKGTARGVQSTLDFKADWAGKTGTSQNWRDSWFVATNPNVTLGVWTGYDNNGMLNRSTYAAETHQLWAGYANSAYQIEPELMSPSKRFEQPSGIVKRTFCGLTDGKVTNMCQAAGLTETDLFNQKYAPTQSVEALEPASGGYKIKPSFLQSHFPYLDLQAADSSLLGKVKNNPLWSNKKIRWEKQKVLLPDFFCAVCV
ncbi:penicillin-binding transpeptidase domain-containing protein [Terrilactibacillus sp. S3-3]|nr:penicillin-binding transpeptidase domain-containing protein [Terrilactibacillus sp. S3-3]